jgi:hypothetical protein
MKGTQVRITEEKKQFSRLGQAALNILFLS